MHIVIDARIINSSTGVYVQRLLHFLHEIKDGHDYTILVPSSGSKKWRDKYPRFKFIVAEQPSYSFAEQLSLLLLLRKLQPDLTHFTMPQQPLLWRGKSVTTIHDTTLIRFDNVDMNPLVYKIRKAIFSFLVTQVITRSQAVFTPTKFVKNDLINYMNGRYADKIIVTVEAGDPVDSDAESLSVLDGVEYLAFVGNAFPYKNIQRVVEAFAILKDSRPHLHLALAGKKDYFYDQLEAYVLDNAIADVHFLGFISHGEKRWLYQHAVAFVTASLSEGFCIPLLEAMFEGCPVVSSNASCLPEVAGEAALYFDPMSTPDLVKQLNSLFADDDLRKLLIAKGNSRVKQFSWERMTQETHTTYMKALKNEL